MLETSSKLSLQAHWSFPIFLRAILRVLVIISARLKFEIFQQNSQGWQGTPLIARIPVSNALSLVSLLRTIVPSISYNKKFLPSRLTIFG